ncbi:3-ketoacyl-ACP reductase [Vibrio galatheae]|uniref:3-ketoacyl-ACP reductase n=1 Tax=Vibrio galatheae TaxID=579748 RepID=A0A0F4NFE5_9VIBR|nr:SDR family oxidoreductase [Vibrio galatheae]KJY81835.1 3-ketoacyl-ACP reductase [Vibrio galatheae]
MINHNPVAIVTGASRGIGAAVACKLAEDGFCVVVNYQNGKDQADSVVATIEERGGTAIAIQADISNPDQVQGLFEQTKSKFGKVSALVNNAGILEISPFDQATHEQLTRTFTINTFGVFYAMQQAFKHLEQGGRIVNLTSTTLALNMPGYGVYNGSKAAVEAFTRVAAKECRGRRISVNAVAPGPVATELFLKGKSPEQIEQFSKMAPLERLGETDDIAHVVAFLCSSAGGWVNGQVIRANGGLA